LERTPDANHLDVLDAGGALIRHDLAARLGRELARPDRPLPASAESFVVVGDRAVVASFDALVVLGPQGWTRETERCERVPACGSTAGAASGRRLGWLEAATGELVHAANAGVGSSWLEYLVRVDGDRFVVMGYDAPRLQLWSNRARARVAEVKLD